MSNVRLKAEDSAVDTEAVASILKNSFIIDKEINKDDLLNMVENWIDEEGDELIADAIIEDELNKLESSEEVDVHDSDDYDDSEEEDDNVIMISTTGERAQRKKLTHVDATAAIDVLREYVSLLNLLGEYDMSLARLQRQIISKRTKA